MLALSMQAAITTRKGNKRFAMFDLRISLAWEGQRAGEEAQVGGPSWVACVMFMQLLMMVIHSMQLCAVVSSTGVWPILHCMCAGCMSACIWQCSCAGGRASFTEDAHSCMHVRAAWNA